MPYLVEAVGPDGVVYAVDVEEEIVAGLRERYGDEGVEVVLGAYDDPRLPDGSLDLVLLVNTYHHIEDRPDYFRRLIDDLGPGGRVVVIEPNEDLGGVLRLALDEGHTSSAPAVLEEMQDGGYAHVASHDLLAVQIFEVFAPARARTAASAP